MWMIVIINHLGLIYTSFPVQMYRVTICKEKLNMYVITGLMDKKDIHLSLLTGRWS